jgi:hypothetical protein
MAGEKREVDKLVSQAAYGALIVCMLGIAGSVLAFLVAAPDASALFLIGSALAFGLLANAVLRQ